LSRTKINKILTWASQSQKDIERGLNGFNGLKQILCDNKKQSVQIR